MQKYDIVIYGATGFTGSLIAEYLAERVVERGDIRWALAGRNIEKLTRVRDEIGASKTPIILADYTDPASRLAPTLSTAHPLLRHALLQALITSTSPENPSGFAR